MTTDTMTKRMLKPARAVGKGPTEVGHHLELERGIGARWWNWIPVSCKLVCGIVARRSTCSDSSQIK